MASSENGSAQSGGGSKARKRLLSYTPAWVAGLIAVSIAAVIGYNRPAILETATLSVFDAYQRSAPREYIPAPVTIVDIDEKALLSRGQWPWPRHHMAELITKLTDAGAQAIAFDIVFAEPDRTSPKRIAKILAENPDADGTFDEVATLRDHDAIFADAVSKSPIVAGVILTNEPNENAPPFDKKAGIAFGGSDPKEALPYYQGIVPNIPEISKTASGIGNVSLRGDNDRTVRRVPLLNRYGENILPSLSIEALRLAQRSSTILVRSTDGSGEGGGGVGIAALKVGNMVVPTNGNGEIWIHYTDRVPDRFVSAGDILNADILEEDLRAKIDGHIILVGTTAPGLRDVIATPLEPIEYGITVHAQAIEQIILGTFLSRPDWAPGAEFIALMLGAIIVVVAISWLDALWGAAVALVFVLAANLATWVAFTNYGWLITPVYMSIALILSYMVTTGWQFFSTAQEKARVRDAFQRYLSPDMVERIADNPENLALGGEVRDITILFSDIRGFTSMSEKMDPEELTNLLNTFLTPMTDELLDHQATIDKYIGDAIMAFWNAPIDVPNHPKEAARATLAMLTRLDEVNNELRFDGNRGNRPPLRMGVGLNTGDCCVGNMGSDQRFAYSCLGDAVNLASRLEGMTKQYAVDIIVGEETAKHLADFGILELDMIRVVGRTEPARIYALLGDEHLATSEQFSVFRANFDAGLEAYRRQDWDHARNNFTAAAKTAPTPLHMDDLIKIFLQRIEAYAISPPPADWDGVFEATKK